MTTFTKTDARQIISRDQLQQLYPNLSGRELDDLLRSIDSDLTLPCRMDASASPNLTVTVQSGIVSNAISSRQRSLPFVGNSIPSFTSGTIVFPATSGSNIVVTPGTDVLLTIPSNQYVKVLVSIDSSGQLVVNPGSANAVEASAAPPAPSPTAMPIGYITVFNNAGMISPIAQNKIYQFMGGGGSGSGSSTGFAQEVSVAPGVTSMVVTFPSPLPNSNYVVSPNFVNETDPTVQYQAITVTNKTAAGFTASWNDETDSANYKIAYIVPAVQEQVGEVNIPMGVSSLVVTLPIALAGVNYSVIPNFVNEVDSPQFQPITITAKTLTSFTASWNDDTDTANYRLSFRVAAFQ